MSHGVAEMCMRVTERRGGRGVGGGGGILAHIECRSSSVGRCVNLKQNEAQNACAESANKGVNYHSKYVTEVRQRPESPTVTLNWHACKYKAHTRHQRNSLKKVNMPLGGILS